MGREKSKTELLVDTIGLFTLTTHYIIGIKPNGWKLKYE